MKKFQKKKLPYKKIKTMDSNIDLVIDVQDQGKRLDKFLSEKIPEYSRAMIQKMIKEKNILINPSSPTGESGQVPAKSSYKIKTGDIIEIKPPLDKIDLSPDPSIKIEIIHDEKDFAVINKPDGLVVYPGTKHKEKTLINGLLAVWPEIKNVGEDPLRPGIVHRLDKDTSGLMIIVKNNIAFQYFKDLFKKHKVTKTYLTLVHGIITPREGIIDFPIRRSESNPVKQVAVRNNIALDKSHPALTRYIVKQYLKDSAGNEYTLAEAMPETGRMHQIRVHFAALGHSIVGDKIYTFNKKPVINIPKRHFLHASNLSLISPEGKNLKFSSPLPGELSDFLKTLVDIQQ
jgi:23S rRNA pseudouridine1911/1915/1917 synthase